MVLALFLDPFWFDVGRSVDDRLLVDSTLPAWRDQAVSLIAVPDPALSGRLARDLSACLDQYSRPASVVRDSLLHPTLRWNLHEEPFSSLQCVALRLFSVSSSASAGERAFKKFRLILYSAPHRTTDDRVNARTRVSVNVGQLGCANGVRNFWRRLSSELCLSKWVASHRLEPSRRTPRLVSRASCWIYRPVRLRRHRTTPLSTKLRTEGATKLRRVGQTGRSW